MGGSRAIKATKPCPTCGGALNEIWFDGNHGEEFLMETHCPYCKYLEGADGVVIEEGDPALKDTYPESKPLLLYHPKERK
jgi:ssDNA-binding Zn-finger/Zn-ribbon topoisomerase 1